MYDDDYEGFIEGDFFSALFVELDKLEELDPEVRNEPWFKLLESTEGKTLAPHYEKAFRRVKSCTKCQTTSALPDASWDDMLSVVNITTETAPHKRP